MERIIKIKESIMYYIFLGLIAFGYLLNENYINSIINSFSPFNNEYAVFLFLYCILLIQYVSPFLRCKIINLRINKKELKKINVYNKEWTVFWILITIVLHLIFWLSLYLNKNSIVIILLSTNYIYYSLLIEKLYIGEEYLIFLNKKYIYKDIEKVYICKSKNMNLVINGREYILFCYTKKVKNKILDIIKQNSIEIIES